MQSFYDKYKCDRRSISPFFKIAPEDAFNYEKEIERLKNMNEEEQSKQFREQYIKLKKLKSLNKKQMSVDISRNTSKSQSNSVFPPTTTAVNLGQLSSRSQNQKKVNLKNNMFFDPIQSITQGKLNKMRIQKLEAINADKYDIMEDLFSPKAEDIIMNAKDLLDETQETQRSILLQPLQISSDFDIKKHSSVGKEDASITLESLNLKNQYSFQSPQRSQSPLYQKKRNTLLVMNGIAANQQEITIRQCQDQLQDFYQALIIQTNASKGKKDQSLINRIQKSLNQQEKIKDMLQDYIYIYKYDKQENEDLQQIVKESTIAMDELKNGLMDSHNKIDNNVAAYHEKEFDKKVKIWHKNSIRQQNFSDQQIDQIAMKYTKKKTSNFNLPN